MSFIFPHHHSFFSHLSNFNVNKMSSKHINNNSNSKSSNNSRVDSGISTGSSFIPTPSSSPSSTPLPPASPCPSPSLSHSNNEQLLSLSPLSPHFHHQQSFQLHNVPHTPPSVTCTSRPATPPPTPPSPLQLPQSFNTPKLKPATNSDLLHSLKLQERHQDACLPPNERRARKAVRYAIRTNQHLDSYQITSIIGFGTNGVVLKAFSTSLNAHVAVKIVYKSEKDIQNAQSSSTPAELVLLKYISQHHPHSNLTQLYDSFQDMYHHYLILHLTTSDWLGPDPSASPETSILKFYNLRLQRFESLSTSQGASDLWAYSIAVCFDLNPTEPISTTHIPTHLPPEHYSKHIFKQIVSAVYHLHSIGIVHGDIKEENVLLQHTSSDADLNTGTSSPFVNPMLQSLPEARLCDLGHARKAPRGYVPTLTKYGTNEMSAPEILYYKLYKSTSTTTTTTTTSSNPMTMAKPDGFKSDIFALGLLLYSLLHGPSKLPPIVDLTTRNPLGAHAQAKEIKRLIRGGTYPILEGCDERLSAEARELLVGMTMLESEERWSLEKVLQHPWLN
jgi:serine/threonine protein kinase